MLATAGDLIAIFVPFGVVVTTAMLAALGGGLRSMFGWMRRSDKRWLDLLIRVVAIETHLATAGTEHEKRRAAGEVSRRMRDQLDVPDVARQVLEDVFGGQ